MTIDWNRYWWVPGFAAGFLAVGVPYWLLPYGKVDLPNPLLGAGLLVVIVAAALTRFYSGRPFLQVAAVMGSVFPAVVMVRVAVEVSRDPTSHNLWPFEVVIAMFVGGVAALPGTMLGSLASWWSRRGQAVSRR
jgi:hypothetical protein